MKVCAKATAKGSPKGSVSHHDWMSFAEDSSNEVAKNAEVLFKLKAICGITAKVFWNFIKVIPFGIG